MIEGASSKNVHNASILLAFVLSPILQREVLTNKIKKRQDDEDQVISFHKTSSISTYKLSTIAQILLINIVSTSLYFAYYYCVAYMCGLLSGDFFYMTIISIVIVVSWCGGYNIIKLLVLVFLLYQNRYVSLNLEKSFDLYTEIMILQRVGNRYRFIHRLVQEYFANLNIPSKSLPKIKTGIM